MPTPSFRSTAAVRLHCPPLAAALVVAALLPFGNAAAQNQQVTIVSSKDNTLYDDPTGSLSNGAGTRMFAGTTGFTTGGQIRRALVAFDVAAAVPQRAKIVAVTLALNVVQTTSGSQAVDLHRVLADWGESTSFAGSGQGGGGPAASGDATWLHRHFSNANWQTPGGDFAATPSGSTMVGGLGSYTWTSTPAMVADVQQWLDNPAQSHGWILRSAEVGSNTAKAFDTKESTTAASRPQLTIVYAPPAAAVVPSGSGCSGGAASALTIAGSGLPQVPNPTFAITLSGGPAAGPRAMLFARDLLPAPLPLGGGCFVHLNPVSLLLTLTIGAGPMPLPVPNNTTFLGFDLALQAAAVDGTTFALATSNGLVLQFGI